jgi:hypothetical protein
MLYKTKALTDLKEKLNFTPSVTSVTGVNRIEVAERALITRNLYKKMGCGVWVGQGTWNVCYLLFQMSYSP